LGVMSVTGKKRKKFSNLGSTKTGNLLFFCKCECFTEEEFSNSSFVVIGCKDALI